MKDIAIEGEIRRIHRYIGWDGRESSVRTVDKQQIRFMCQGTITF